MSGIFDLSGCVAIVTGANTGIGQALAVGLAGAGVAIVGVSRGSSDETAGRIADAGGLYHGVTADLSSIGCVDAITQATVDRFGSVDILLNNAGTIRRSDALDFSEEDWDDVMNVNLKSVFFLSQSVARHLVASGRPGKIINIASMLSYQGGIRVASYTSSKSGVMGLTRLLANEWAAKGINVNAIAPGYIATNNTAALRADPERNQDILKRIPAGRWGDPSDLVGAAIFLASRASDYMHGTTVPVDGGWLAR
jgi:2-deoxy-D-gluconate 3-dehydrogenase